MVNRVKTCAVIVAHPDDETLWSGGTILGHPEWQWFVVSLCRKSDKEREAKFYQAMIRLGADGTMGDLDDGPAQSPQNIQEVAQIVLDLLPVPSFDLIITHSPQGEYTRHLRHEETSLAVLNLLESRKISTKELWLFAYEDHQRTHYPLITGVVLVLAHIPILRSSLGSYQTLALLFSLTFFISGLTEIVFWPPLF